MIGADPAALERLASSMGTSAKRLDRIRANTRAQLHSVHWTGTDADAIRRDWDGRYSQILASAAHLLAAAETRLRHEAQQQIDASSANAGTTIGPPSLRTPGSRESFDYMLVLFGGLSGAKLVHGAHDAVERIAAIRALTKSNAIRAALGLGPMSAENYIKAVGGKVSGMTVLGVAIGAAETYSAARESGWWSAEVADKGVGTVGSTGAGLVAGPLGGLAWSVGYDGSRALLKWSGGDKILEGFGADRYQKFHDAMFGKVPVAPEHTKEWIKSASPQERQAWLDQIARERAVAQAPIGSSVWSAVKGIFR